MVLKVLNLNSVKRNSTNQIDIKLAKLLQNVGDMSLKRRAQSIIDGLEIQDGDNVIDIGCGDGYYLYLLLNLPVKLSLTGYDNDKIVLENAKKNLRSKKIRLVLGTAENIQLRDESFEKIIMTEVLEHIEQDKKALKEIYRLLKPNGMLLLTVPSYNFPFLWDPINWILQNLLGTHIGGSGFLAGIWARHLRLYRKDALEKIVKNAGFKIEKIEELTTRCLPFNHYLVNAVARFLYDIKPSSKLSGPISKFKNVEKPWLIRLMFFLVNTFDKLNDIVPGKNGLNIYIKAIK